MAETERTPMRTPIWMRSALVAAGVYNLAWGAAVVLFPFAMFDWLDLTRPNWPQIWQCLGMVIGVYGIGYLIAATNPMRHWPIVLVGFPGKIFGPIGFVYGASRGEFPWSFGWLILLNDLIWWIPFGAILLRAHGQSNAARDLP